MRAVSIRSRLWNRDTTKKRIEWQLPNSHLALLRMAGLIEIRREGKHNYAPFWPFELFKVGLLTRIYG